MYDDASAGFAPLRVLCITHYFPLPLDMGGAIRVFGLVRELGGRHSVHLLAPRRADTPDALVEDAAKQLGATVEAVGPLPPAPSGVAGRSSLWVRSLAERTPPWVLGALHEELVRRAIELAPGFDAVVLLDDYVGVYTGALRAAAPGVPIVADKPVVLGAAEHPRRAGMRARMVRRSGRALTRAFERRYLAEVDAAVVTSPEEADRFERLYRRRPDAAIVSAVDLPAPAPGGDPFVVGWLGSMDGPPVVDGLIRFVEEAWEPLGLEGFELRIAGRAPTDAVRALERHPGVKVVGYVEDLDGFLGEIGAAVVPLWGGQGVKLKTLTLLGAGLPVAATPVALEGVPAEDATHCMVADEPRRLAAALCRIAADERLAAQLRRQSRALIAERFSWERVAPEFADVVERAAAARRRPPAVAGVAA